MSECGRCHRIIEGEMRFIQGCDIHVCPDCADEAYEKCQCCGGYLAGEDMVYPEDEAMCIWCASERYLICPHCREYMRKDEAVEFHGHLMCENCRDAYFSQCDCCHERFETTELTDAEDDEAGKSVKVCPDCLRKKFRRCVECGSWENFYYTLYGKVYCTGCCEYCWNCGEPTPSDKLETINTADGYHDVCPDCYDLFDQCAVCGNECPKEKLHKINDEWYCEDCLPKYIAQLKGEERAQAMRQLDAKLVGVAAGLAIFHGLNAMNKRGHNPPWSPAPADDDEAQFDDGYPDDYVGDGLDGTDDYVGDGLDGSDDCDDSE